MRKFFWLFVMPILWIVGAKAIALKSYDRPVDFVEPTAQDLLDPEVREREEGVSVDRRALFELRQDAEFAPYRENGFRDVLAAWGPRALGQDALADEIPWEEFPTDERSKGWFETVWTPLCEKFELDPNAKPSALERPELERYLSENGITGQEPEQDPRVDSEAIAACMKRLDSNPWTAAQFPMPARWIQSNAELYDVFAKALRKSKFGSPRALESALGQIEATELGDLDGQRKIARYFVARANFRIGLGDVEGAIDDVESILRLAKFTLDSQAKFPTDRLVALSVLESALSVGLYANANRQPTLAETERWNAIWFELFAEYDFNAALKRALDGVRDVLLLPTAQDLCRARRELGSSEKVVELFSKRGGESSEEGQVSQQTKKSDFFLFKSSFDERFLLETLTELLARREKALMARHEFEFDPQKAFTETPGARKRSTESSFALSLFLASIKPVDAFADELRRIANLAQMRSLANGLLAYQQERGTLPPAYSVDPLGKPGLSWRVLILPYLGEKNRALYERFNLNEAWNSETNAPLVDEMPNCMKSYAEPDRKDGTTPYAVVLGQDALFGYGGATRDLKALRARPGGYTHLQALVVEKRQAAQWTRPNVEVDAHECRETFGKEDGVLALTHKGEGVNVASASGAVCTRNVKPLDPNAQPKAVAELLISGK